MMHDIHEQQIELEKKYDEIEQTNYAGFWVRCLAYVLDFVAILVFATIGGLFMIPLGATNVSGEVIGILIITYIIALAFWYFILMQASKKQGTWGKQICKIYIGDKHGNRISVGRSLLRFLGTYLSAFVYVGYILVAFTEKKQSLHDMIAGTYVYKKQ